MLENTRAGRFASRTQLPLEPIAEETASVSLHFENTALDPGPKGQGVALIERFEQLQEWPIEAGVATLPAEIGDRLRLWRIEIGGVDWTYPDLDIQVTGRTQQAEVWPGQASAYHFEAPGGVEGPIVLAYATIGGVRFGDDLPFGEVRVTSPFAVPFAPQNERWFDARSDNGWARFVPEPPQVGSIRALDVQRQVAAKIVLQSQNPVGGAFFMAHRDVEWGGEVFPEQRAFAIRVDDWRANAGGYQFEGRLDGLIAGEYRVQLKGEGTVPDALEPTTLIVTPGPGEDVHRFRLRDTDGGDPVDVRFVLRFAEPLADLSADLPFLGDVVLRPVDPDLLLRGQPRSVSANLAALPRVDGEGRSVLFQPRQGARPGNYRLLIPSLALCEEIVVDAAAPTQDVVFPPIARVTMHFEHHPGGDGSAAATTLSKGLAPLLAVRSACGESQQLNPIEFDGPVHRFLMPWGSYTLRAFPPVTMLRPATIEVALAEQHFDVEVVPTVAREVRFERNGETLWLKLEDVHGLRATRIGDEQPLDGVKLLGMRPQTMSYHGVVLDAEIPGAYRLQLQLRGPDGQFVERSVTVDVPGDGQPATVEL
ncbi:MAG: hypothetical protein GC161_11795 [Planctomycetaceae bacterium]|nr:hypothetical protein [Planctomycetaceae bacterium]